MVQQRRPLSSPSKLLLGKFSCLRFSAPAHHCWEESQGTAQAALRHMRAMGWNRWRTPSCMALARVVLLLAALHRLGSLLDILLPDLFSFRFHRRHLPRASRSSTSELAKRSLLQFWQCTLLTPAVCTTPSGWVMAARSIQQSNTSRYECSQCASLGPPQGCPMLLQVLLHHS